jgi:hypothetical protein
VIHATSPLSLPRARAAGARSDFAQAPDDLVVNGQRYTFVDLQTTHVEVTLDAAGKQATARAVTTFEQRAAGFPIVDLTPNPSRVIIDGREIPPALYAKVQTDPKAALRALSVELGSGSHRLEVEYPLTSGVVFDERGAGVSFFSHISDFVSTDGLAQRYFPANLEYDQFQATMELRLEGTSRAHEIIANGQVIEGDEPGTYALSFPAYYNATSFFIDVIDPSTHEIARGTYEGLNGPIPVIAYAPKGGASVRPFLERAKKILEDAERDLGAFPHAKFIVQAKSASAGGMEYPGAAESSPEALRHEMLHSWFGRGVMPALGRDNWLDEAIAVWLDQQPSPLTTPPTPPNGPLAYSSMTLQGTPRSPEAHAYIHGNAVMRYLDHVLRGTGGLKPLLRDFFQQYQRETVTTEMFVDFVKARSPVPLEEFFRLQIYGHGSSRESQFPASPRGHLWIAVESTRGEENHPS